MIEYYCTGGEARNFSLQLILKHDKGSSKVKIYTNTEKTMAHDTKTIIRCCVATNIKFYDVNCQQS
jgi:hypothetical protein